MNTFVIEELVTYRKVTYYTVRWDESDLSETDKFISKYRQNVELRRDLDEILKLIEDIGRFRGAKDMYFRRHAGAAVELPPLGKFEIDSVEVSYFENRLRLFCIKVSDNIVIMFNGGEKTSLRTQDSPALVTPFRDAQTFARRILKARVEEEITINYQRNTLQSAYGDDPIVLI